MVGFLFISTVNAGWFDFLSPAEEKEISIQDEFDSAKFGINASYENASVILLESTPLEKNFHPEIYVDTIDLSEYGVDKANVAVGSTNTKPSTCKIQVKLNIDLKNATLVELRNNSKSIMGTPVEDELTGNLSSILDDSFNKKNNWSTRNLEFSFAATNPKSGKSEGHNLPISLKNASYKDGILSFTEEVSDNSTGHDFSEIIGGNSTVSFYMHNNKTSIYYYIHMPPISGG